MGSRLLFLQATFEDALVKLIRYSQNDLSTTADTAYERAVQHVRKQTAAAMTTSQE